VKGIILPIQDTDLITVPGHITEEVQSWWRLAIGLTIAAPVIGTDARITSGSQATGHGGTVSRSGSVAITSCEGTELRADREKLLGASFVRAQKEAEPYSGGSRLARSIKVSFAEVPV
jgi:hypothetical protein